MQLAKLGLSAREDHAADDALIAQLQQALIRDKRIDTLFLLPASQTRDKDALTEDGVGRVIAELRQEFDWVICDSPAGI